MNEKISVIIPTKNRTQDVIRCLESLSIQTILPDEVVIVDSSEIEELKSVLHSFDDLNIKYIHDIEASLTRAENIGVENSIGDIIIILLYGNFLCLLVYWIMLKLIFLFLLLVYAII